MDDCFKYVRGTNVPTPQLIMHCIALPLVVGPTLGGTVFPVCGTKEAQMPHCVTHQPPSPSKAISLSNDAHSAACHHCNQHKEARQYERNDNRRRFAECRHLFVAEMLKLKSGLVHRAAEEAPGHEDECDKKAETHDMTLQSRRKTGLLN